LRVRRGQRSCAKKGRGEEAKQFHLDNSRK